MLSRPKPNVKLRPGEGYNKYETLSHMCSKTGGETRPTVLQCQAPLSIYIRATKIDVPKILTVMCYIRAYSKNIG